MILDETGAEKERIDLSRFSRLARSRSRFAGSPPRAPVTGKCTLASKTGCRFHNVWAPPLGVSEEPTVRRVHEP